MTSQGGISALGARTFASRLASQLLVGIGSVLVARALGATGRGRYYLAVTIVTIAYYLANMGLEQAQFRLWSRKEATADELATSAALFSAGLGATGAALTYLAYVAGPESVFAGLKLTDLTIALVALPVLLHSLLLTGLLTMVNDDLALVNVAILIGAIVQAAVLLFLFSIGSLTVEASLALYVLNGLVAWAVMLARSGRTARLRRPVPWRLMAMQLKIGSQFEPSLLFYYLNLRLDVVFVRQYLGLSSVGIYSIAVVIAELVWLATDSLAWSIRSRQANASAQESVEVTMRAVRVALLLAALSSAAIAVAVPFVVPLAYGREFTSAAHVVWTLLPATGGMAIWRVAGPLLIRYMPPWVTPFISMVALAVNVAANVILIPRIGIAGAGLASSLSYWSAALLVLVCLARAGHVRIHDAVPRTADVLLLLDLAQGLASRCVPRTSLFGRSRP